MIDPTPLWDFDDPSGSEQRFRAAAEEAVGDDQIVLLTQAARALGLQEQYDEGHAVLDHLSPTAPEAAVRVALERGRLFHSAGQTDEARPHFDAAAQTASSLRLDALHVDALHMLALTAEPADQRELNERALAVARGSSDPVARDWEASLLNNIGMTLAEAGDFVDALSSFEDALAARQQTGSPHDVRVARWMVAWALRHLDRSVEALVIQRALKAELDAAHETDHFVDEELALLEG